MKPKLNITDLIHKKLLLSAITIYIAAVLLWAALFYNNPVLKDVLTDIQLIFTSTLLGYLIVLLVFNRSVVDFIKVFVRTLFRVWLFIFISFAIAKAMDRIGLLLSVSFIFGYFEGLLDIDKWLQYSNPFPRLLPLPYPTSKINHGLASILLMSIVHILCGFVIFLLYLFMF